MILDFPEGDFDGIIFDCDGTLVDSMPLHFRAWTASFVHHEAPWHWTEDEFYASAGVPDRVTVMALNSRYGVNLDPERVYDYKAEWYSRYVSELAPVPAVANLARKYHAAGTPVSVASGSELSLVLPSLAAAGLEGLFDIVITPADVARGKPAPDMFLLAAERMGISPERCLVFEDGKPGIEAAEAAGMRWVFVPSRFG